MDERQANLCMRLELVMRRASGDRFQQFFGDLMAAAYSGDFVRVRPFGAAGDMGCDAYLLSTKTLFACYGKVGDSSPSAKGIAEKIKSDFKKAVENFPWLKAWYFVHNLMDGLPAEAIIALNELQQQYPGIQIGQYARERLEPILLNLPLDAAERLVGNAPSVRDYDNPNFTDIQQLVQHLLQGEGPPDLTLQPISEVSQEKLRYNSLSSSHAQLLLLGFQNAYLIGEYFRLNSDASAEERLADIYRSKYANLKAQAMGADAMFTEIMAMTLAHVTMPNAGQMVAAQTVMAYFFEHCDIFEDVPKGS